MSQSNWFRDARYDWLIHFGSYSLTGREAAWPLQWDAISYRDFEALADRFNPQKYDPRAWAQLTCLP